MINAEPLFNVKPGELWTSDYGLSMVAVVRDVSKIVNLFVSLEYGTVIIEVIH